MSMNGYNGANKITSHKGKESNHRKVIKNENELNKEAKKEMHRKCESVSFQHNFVCNCML